jgi:signal transduction histidine kinase
MTSEQYEQVIQEKGVHSLIISLSTDELHKEVWNDLLLRSLVSLFAMGGGIISTLAWRNVEKNSELQIRLVKAGEMNAHLKELNLAAAGLAHETRNPLNMIRGLAQMVAMQTESSPKFKEQASAIVEEADRVTAQLNEFIDYSKPREAHFAPVDVKRLVADVTRALQPDIEEKQVQLTQPETAFVVLADEPLLRQALFNVLLNASQAVGQNGKIKVRAARVGAREAVLEISDDGPGVPAAERENIFKPYVTMRPNGVGLGLAIVQQIAAAHRWEVACLANEPHGALFRFSGLRVATPHQ